MIKSTHIMLDPTTQAYRTVSENVNLYETIVRTNAAHACHDPSSGIIVEDHFRQSSADLPHTDLREASNGIE